MIYAVLLQILISLNLCSFSLPMTWSSSILHSPTLPVKPILTLCHPLDERLEAYLISVKEGCIKVHKFKKKCHVVMFRTHIVVLHNKIVFNSQ